MLKITGKYIQTMTKIGVSESPLKILNITDYWEMCENMHSWYKYEEFGIKNVFITGVWTVNRFSFHFQMVWHGKHIWVV